MHTGLKRRHFNHLHLHKLGYSYNGSGKLQLQEIIGISRYICALHLALQLKIKEASRTVALPSQPWRPLVCVVESLSLISIDLSGET